MEQKILLINEIAAKMRVSASSIRRWLAERRKGIGNFPLPISRGEKRGTLRWNSADIERYIASQSDITVPVSIPSIRQHRQSAKELQERSRRADEALERHRTGTK